MLGAGAGLYAPLRDFFLSLYRTIFEKEVKKTIKAARVIAPIAGKGFIKGIKEGLKICVPVYGGALAAIIVIASWIIRNDENLK